ncbi:serine/threonine protein kinase [Streptomyces diacarni]|uniref:non-specific serine/threonine protein kinase n=1 Tax=Streptomyces diacarni TaxID=2800381 RepID=A0A367EWW7_9ACTN|nr:serine/threonine-protein kinase [Streptomyces diacarni]RCG22075.1 serine/threonine protein kinase [Streptomyces diacarni]
MTGGGYGRPGDVVDGRFELLERLGSGGMGTVWRARDTALDREVALKEVRQPALGPGHDPDEAHAGPGAGAPRERVLREARALARLSHPHVVTIHHIVDAGPCPWLVMELVRGPSLEQRLAEGPLEPREAARLGREVLSALRTAHAAGIHHRDVKPGNVLLREDGAAVLTDFGIAALQGSATVTATGEFLGSPEFVAPERVRGVEDDPAGDLWSLGLTLYVSTEAHSPLRRATTLATIAAVLDDPVPPPVRSGALGPVLEAVLVRDPAARPTAEALERMLADVAEGRAATPYLPTETSMPVRSPSASPPGTVPPGTVPSGTGPSGTGPSGADPSGTGPSGTGPSPATRPGAVPTGTAAGGGSGAGTAAHVPGGASGAGRRPGRAPLVVAAAVVAAGLVAAGAFVLTRPDGTGKSADDMRSPLHTPAATDAGGRSPGSGPSAAETGPGRESRKPADKGTKKAEDPTKEPTAGPAAPERQGPGDRWVAQLGSVAKSEGVAAREKMRASLSRKVPVVRHVDSDRFASLRAGYWMFYAPGPPGGFASGRAAADWCGERGLASSNQCVGRYVSDDPADRVHVCSPDKSRGTGRCRR